MLERVKGWVAAGKRVKLFTARVATDQDPFEVMEFKAAFRVWCAQHGLPDLPCTAEKNRYCLEIWDDRAVQVEPNTGRQVGADPLG